ncbi:MAG: glycosyl hydrolase family 18 protein [Chloroflexi bacterium]|nr:glycosyl hydrolase family 18 protein [Chloroflexota bacterium]
MLKQCLYELFRKRSVVTLWAIGGLLPWFTFTIQGPSQVATQAASLGIVIAAGQMLTNTAPIFMPFVVNGLAEVNVEPTILPWAAKTVYAVGAQVTYNGATYQCLQAHTAQVGWEPATTPALWQLLTNQSTPTRTPSPTVTTPTSTATPIVTSTPRRPTETPVPGGAEQWPHRVFAPYVDVMLWPTFALAETAGTTGSQYYTLAFIISGGGCAAAWGGVTPIDQDFLLEDIQHLRAQGGNVIVSFGGAAGVELGQACSMVSSLQAQYQAVIDRYDFTHLDFDIEGGASADPASITRRNQAIAGLQADAISAGNPLQVSYTLPVLPIGLTNDGLNLLNDAVAHGVTIDVVNIMAMDYGSVAPPDKMGANAIQAANSVFGQLQAIYPAKTAAQIWAMIGVTPMIGLNDVSPEVFTLSDAQALLTFAQQNNIAQLAMWSMTRDQQCPGSPSVSATCSGITQSPWGFTNIFKSFMQ